MRCADAGLGPCVVRECRRRSVVIPPSPPVVDVVVVLVGHARPEIFPVGRGHNVHLEAASDDDGVVVIVIVAPLEQRRPVGGLRHARRRRAAPVEHAAPLVNLARPPEPRHQRRRSRRRRRRPASRLARAACGLGRACPLPRAVPSVPWDAAGRLGVVQLWCRAAGAGRRQRVALRGLVGTGGWDWRRFRRVGLQHFRRGRGQARDAAAEHILVGMLAAADAPREEAEGARALTVERAQAGKSAACEMSTRCRPDACRGRLSASAATAAPAAS